MTSPLQLQINALREQLQELERRQGVADLMRADTHKMLAEIHQLLMVPQPGNDGRNLLERMATVTTAIEAGDRAAETLTKWLKRVTAVGVLVIAIGAFIAKIEIWKGTQP